MVGLTKKALQAVRYITMASESVKVLDYAPAVEFDTGRFVARYLQILGWLSIASMIVAPLAFRRIHFDLSFIFLFAAAGGLKRHSNTARKWVLFFGGGILFLALAMVVKAIFFGTAGMFISLGGMRIRDPKLWQVIAGAIPLMIVAAIPFFILLSPRARRQFGVIVYKSPLSIRAENASDVHAIHTLHAASFPTPAEAQLVDALRASDRLHISLVADEDGHVVGHVAFSPVTVDCNNAAAGAGLGPIAVQWAHRRRGVAATLIEEGLRRCKIAGVGWVVVLGDPKYYKRFGFRPAREFGLSDEFGGGDAFMALELINGAIPSEAGLVKYAPEFALVA